MEEERQEEEDAEVRTCLDCLGRNPDREWVEGRLRRQESTANPRRRRHSPSTDYSHREQRPLGQASRAEEIGSKSDSSVQSSHKSIVKPQKIDRCCMSRNTGYMTTCLIQDKPD